MAKIYLYLSPETDFAAFCRILTKMRKHVKPLILLIYMCFQWFREIWLTEFKSPRPDHFSQQNQSVLPLPHSSRPGASSVPPN
jgi:hypothetical protein